MRAWNVLVLAALGSSPETAPSRLFDCFSAFVLTYAQSLHPYQHSQQPVDLEFQELAHRDLSNAYAALKLWLLLARKMEERRSILATDAYGFDGHSQTGALEHEVLLNMKVWNELWPPFESVISAFEEDAYSGYQSIKPLASTVWASVMDLITFLRHSRSVALDLSLETQMLDRLRRVVRDEAKTTRLMRIINEPPPELPLDYFVKQVTTELQAEEKLQAAKRQDAFPEKRRVFS